MPETPHLECKLFAEDRRRREAGTTSKRPLDIGMNGACFREACFNATPSDTHGPKRAVLYLRVSTGRQAANDVSLPSQRDVTTTHCMANNWIVVDEYVEAATATDDRGSYANCFGDGCKLLDPLLN